MGTADKLAVPQQAFKAADDWFVFSAPSQNLWELACRALDAVGLTKDRRFTSNKDRIRNRVALIDALDSIVAAEDRSLWLESLKTEGVPCAPKNSLSEAFTHPQTVHDALVIDQDHPTAGPIKLPSTPIRLRGTPLTVKRPAPLVGEHTREVLSRWSDLDDDKVDSLFNNNIAYEPGSSSVTN